MEFYFGFIHHWDKILVGLLALGALYLLIRKFRKGECNCGSCSKAVRRRNSRSAESL